MPTNPRRTQLAVSHNALEQWVNLRPLVRGPVDADLMVLQIPRAEVPDLILRKGYGLISTIFVPVELRPFDSEPRSLHLSLRDDINDVDVEADVITLADLPAHLSMPSL